MGKRKGNKKALKSDQVQSNKSMEEILSPTAKMKEDIEIKGDSSDVFIIEERDQNSKILEESKDEEIEAVVDLEVKLIVTLEDLDAERRKNKKHSKKIEKLNLQEE